MLEASDWTVLAVGSFFGLLGSVGAVAIWRGHPNARQLWEMGGDGGPYWRGFVRAIPVGVLLWWVLLAVYALASWASSGVSDAGFGLAVPTWVAVVGIATPLVGFLVVAAVALTNRPSFLVPPDLREESGLTNGNSKP